MISKNAKPQRRSQAERRETTRKKLVDAAYQVLENGGYGDCTIKNVANQAEMTTGAVQHHFKTRSDLLNAVVFERLFVGSGQPVNVDHAPHSVERLCRDMINGQWKLYSDSRHLVTWEIIFGARRDSSVWDAFSKRQHLLFNEGVNRVFYLFEHHGLSKQQAEDLLHFTLIKMSGLGLSKMQFPELDTDRQVELLIEAAIALVKKMKQKNAHNNSSDA